MTPEAILGSATLTATGGRAGTAQSPGGHFALPPSERPSSHATRRNVDITLTLV